jgi:multicomponent Na+:H+ antiporter subunit D
MRGHHEQNQSRFFACFGLAIFASVGAAMAGNMLTLFF